MDLLKLADRHERLGRQHPEFGNRQLNAGIVIVADPGFIRTFSGQVTWATLLNLAARLYNGIRRIRLLVDSSVPKLPCVFFPNALPDLREASLRFLEQLNADGAFTIEEGVPSENVEEWIWVYVGHSDPRGPSGMTVAGQGWVAFVNDDGWQNLGAMDNPIGPMVAACLATAEIYKSLYPLRQGRGSTRIVLSGFDYSGNPDSNPALPSVINLPNTYIAGVGAIGMALLGTLNSTPAIRPGGGLHVIDDDMLDETNLNRCILATVDDITRPKTEIIETRLDAERLALKVYRTKWQSFVEMPEHRDPLNFQLVVSCVDQYSARLAVQYDRLPKILFTAGTGDFLLGVSRHKLDDGLSCAVCHQSRDPDQACGTATEGAQAAFKRSTDPSISFVSALAGVLLAAELLKEVIAELRSRPLQNTVRVQLLTGAAKVIARSKDSDCNCSSKYVALGYESIWHADLAQSC